MTGLELVLGKLESPRVRDLERRFIQRFGWTAMRTIDRQGRLVWRWTHDRLNRDYQRGQAFAKEFARQAR